ncbi:unnamed protein product [Protopolystoma xenopodis]|uniref:Uncharacterized protein n=1 Tax=Protopolystoma xenopodis TaxID=117903 RepID=A0A448WK72_9PLAT|nr:unnamed protein product [Protopolystoma xenopodis]
MQTGFYAADFGSDSMICIEWYRFALTSSALLNPPVLQQVGRTRLNTCHLTDLLLVPTAYLATTLSPTSSHLLWPEGSICMATSVFDGKTVGPEPWRPERQSELDFSRFASGVFFLLTTWPIFARPRRLTLSRGQTTDRLSKRLADCLVRGEQFTEKTVN